MAYKILQNHLSLQNNVNAIYTFKKYLISILLFLVRDERFHVPRTGLHHYKYRAYGSLWQLKGLLSIN